MDGRRHTNRLIHSASPYLLQHAHNPVDWHPWGDEALGRAKREDKPIFLSIGYSACHWCHVMERESFENEEIARIMNEHFVCIKVDREERPDLDEIYMNAVQVLTGSGGWPLSVFLTPDLEPFYGGTYFPPTDQMGRPGFARVLLAVADAYRERREEIQQNTRQVVEAIEAMSPAAATGPLEVGLIDDAVRELGTLFDPVWGGFGGPPKFPQSAAISLLLRRHHRTGSEDALRMATVTLDKMACGGIYDQVGGGFHRYSVDGEWLVPHFEKMLYDNALLADVYLDAFLLTGKPLYARVARETLDYVLREMTDEAGGFHSAQDADSEGVEGKYYLWRADEIGELLPADDAAAFAAYYGVTEGGNFEGRNILHVPMPLEQYAEREGVDAIGLERRLRRMRARLLSARARRVAPAKDDKILADWNGLMISALARGYQVLGVEAHRAAAERAARFVLSTMMADGRLLHAHRAGRSHVDAFLDDHAFLVQALLDLCEATFDAGWIEHARALAAAMIERFWDAEAGGFYAAASGQSDLIARSKRGHDASIPSGNSVAAHVLLRLTTLTGNEEYAAKAEQTISAFTKAAQRSPSAFAGMLCALDFHLGPTREVVIAGDPEHADTKRLLKSVRRSYLPNKVLALVDPRSQDGDRAADLIPILASKPMVGGKPTAYVCHAGACRPPVTSAKALARLLREQSPAAAR